MPALRPETKLIRQIIKKYGETINLRDNPAVMIDILREFGVMSPDGGLPPGGTPTPPGPTSHIASEASIDDLMREILKISREVSKMRKHIGR